MFLCEKNDDRNGYTWITIFMLSFMHIICHSQICMQPLRRCLVVYIILITYSLGNLFALIYLKYLRFVEFRDTWPVIINRFFHLWNSIPTSFFIGLFHCRCRFIESCKLIIVFFNRIQKEKRRKKRDKITSIGRTIKIIQNFKMHYNWPYL